MGAPPPPDLQLKDYHHKLAAREPFGPIEFQRMQDGQALWTRTIGEPRFDTYGAFIGYRGVAFDITSEVTERQAKEQSQTKLQRSLAVLSATIHSLPFAICVFDSELKLAIANEQYFDMFQLPRSRFPLGSRAEDIFVFLKGQGEFSGTSEEQLVAHMGLLRGGESHSFARTRPNGTRLEILGVALPGGGFVKMILDITHRQEKEWRLEGTIVNLKAKIRMLEEVLGV